MDGTEKQAASAAARRKRENEERLQKERCAATTLKLVHLMLCIMTSSKMHVSHRLVCTLWSNELSCLFAALSQYIKTLC